MRTFSLKEGDEEVPETLAVRGVVSHEQNTAEDQQIFRDISAPCSDGAGAQRP